MIYELEIKEEADFEITEGYLYYEGKRFGLGEEFLESIEYYLQRICENPKYFQIKKKNYREAFIRRFPYLIIYEIIQNTIIVYSVFNTPQDPEKKP